MLEVEACGTNVFFIALAQMDSVYNRRGRVSQHRGPILRNHEITWAGLVLRLRFLLPYRVRNLEGQQQ